MPQTPKSISANVLGSGTPAAAVYTVPAATTAVVKTALGVNVVGGSSTFTLQKQSGGVNYPLILTQTPTITPATGGTAFNSRNLLDGPITLAAGESILVSDTASPSFRFPQTSNNFTTFTSTQLVPRAQAFANGIYIQVGSDNSNSTSFVVRSTDAVTWTQIATGNLLPSGSYYIANVGNTWVVGTWYSTSYMYSTDNALTWTAASLPTNANIYSLAASNTTFVFGTGIGLYTSTNGSTWTLNTAYNTYIGTTPANDSYSPQGVTWNGTNLFISNYEGTVFTSDLSTYTALYCFNGGAYRANSFWGVTWSPAYSRYYTPNWKSTGADVIISSTNGFTWSATATGTNIFSGTPVGRVACAGSNTILIAKTGMGGTQYLKSTNGTTWSSTSDVRGFAGIIRGMDNGYFFVAETSGASGRAYLTTDPSLSNGTLMTAGIGSAAQFRDAASNGTGWVAVYYSTSTGYNYAAHGPNGTTVTSASVTVDATGSYGNLSGIVWWAAASVYIAWTDQGYIFYSSDGSSGNWNLSNLYSSQLTGSNVRMVPVGSRLYATSSNNTSGGGGFIYTTTTTYTTATNWVFTAISSNMYSNGNQGYFLNNGAQYSAGSGNSAGALATNGTDILYSNGYGGIAVFTPSVSGSSFRTPGTGGLIVERVNNLDIVYTGRTYSGNGTYGAYYGSNIITTLPTAQFSTSSGNALSFNYTQTPSSVFNSFGAFSFLNGNYYAVPLAGSGNTISYGTDLRTLTNRTWGSTSIGAVNMVLWNTSNNSNNPFVSNGTTLTTFNNVGNNLIRTWSGDPANALAASVITLSVVEVS